MALENIESWSGRFVPTDSEFDGDGVAFEAGDLLFGKLRPYLAKALLADIAGEAVGDFHVMRPLPLMIPRYLQYTVLDRSFIEIVDGCTFGSKMPRASWESVGSMVIPTPPLEEQRAIVSFLDRETAQIDALIAEQERLIELLKEKRQAVISHAVTKGLDPDVPMKDSGVEWLGKVPAHWEVRRLGSLASIVRGASPRPAGDTRYFHGNHTPWVTVAEITKDDNADLSETREFLTEEGAKFSRLFRRGTLIYSNSGATLGVPKILRLDACANDGVVGFENLSTELTTAFLYHYLSALTQTIREMVKQGAGQPNLNTDIVKTTAISLPPMDEQVAICAYVGEIVSEFNALGIEAERAIELLKERRTALITAAVTGQIDVCSHSESDLAAAGA
ncbi:MAG: hypothetical protein B6D36_00305 [Planctomycetes bacterium UTPLA1]|nr:MAG: hypothetical protein B6D36_00305 [Planctomycetes bacterium UTPLA1]